MTNQAFNIVRIIDFVLLALLIESILLWWFVLRQGRRRPITSRIRRCLSEFWH